MRLRAWLIFAFWQILAAFCVIHGFSYVFTRPVSWFLIFGYWALQPGVFIVSHLPEWVVFVFARSNLGEELNREMYIAIVCNSILFALALQFLPKLWNRIKPS